MIDINIVAVVRAPMAAGELSRRGRRGRWQHQ
jgi:hypothetical protein